MRPTEQEEGATIIERATKNPDHCPLCDNPSAVISHKDLLMLLIRYSDPDPEKIVNLRWVSDCYHDALKQSTSALAHLAHRGITEAAIDHFSVGYGAKLPLASAGSRAGKAQRTQLRRLGVLHSKGYEYLKECIVVPLYNQHGQVVQMYGRRIRQRREFAHHCYLARRSEGIFNRKGITGRHVILCETPLPAAAFWSAGLIHVTSCSGGFTNNLRRALTNRRIKRVTLAFGAGTEAQKEAERIGHEFRSFQSVYVASDATPEAVSNAVWLRGPR